MTEMHICPHCDDTTVHDDDECQQCGRERLDSYHEDGGLNPAEEFAYQLEAATYDDLPEVLTYNEETGDFDVEMPDIDPEQPLDEQYEEAMEE